MVRLIDLVLRSSTSRHPIQRDSVQGGDGGYDSCFRMTTANCWRWRIGGMCCGSLILVLIALLLDCFPLQPSPLFSSFSTNSIQKQGQQYEEIQASEQSKVNWVEGRPELRHEKDQSHNSTDHRAGTLAQHPTRGGGTTHAQTQGGFPPASLLDGKIVGTEIREEEADLDRMELALGTPEGQVEGDELACDGVDSDTERVQEDMWSNYTLSTFETCDVTIGAWVENAEKPLYTGLSCPLISPTRRCDHRGLDTKYLQRQWVPLDCPLPWPLDGKKLLQQLQNQTVLIVGDSVSSTFAEALLCALATFAPVKVQPYTSHGLQGSHVYYIQAHGIVVKQLQIEWLVAWDESEASFHKAGIKYKHDQVLLHIDSVDARWADALEQSVDVLVLSSGSHWNSRVSKILFSNQEVVYMDWSVAYRHSLETVRSFIENSAFKGLKLYRTYSPLHWLDGKQQRCGGDDVLEPARMASSVVAREQCVEIQKELFNPLSGWLTMDITEMSLERMDGHPGMLPLASPTRGGHRRLLRKRRKGQRSRSSTPVVDCSSWCTPGVPDHWVTMFHALLAQTSLRS